MKLSVFLENIKENQKEVVHYCCSHILSKKFDINEDSVEDEVLKEFFINYDNFTKALNDSAGIIYKKYETEMDDIYKSVCNIFEEDHDNAYLFNYRLARIVNQEPRQFLDIEDKINTVLASKYYKDNENKLSQNLIIPRKTLELIKSAAGIY